MPTRRAVLTADVGAAVARCRPGPEPRAGRPDPDAAVRARAAAAEHALLATYDAVLAAHPDLAPRLSAPRAEHAAHLAALRHGPAPGPTASERPSGDLVALERRAAADRLADCLTASDPALARLLASIGACEAVHAATLGVAGRAP